MSYRYYSTQRPVMPGSFPKPENNRVEEIFNFDSKTYAEEIQQNAWGYIEYEKPLGHFDIVNYELVAVKTKTLHLKYLGRDSRSRYVYEDENGKLWKDTNCCIPREYHEERNDRLCSSLGNEFDGEPDCFMPAHIAVEYIRREGVDMDKRLTEKQIEEMAVEIREFLLEHNMWQDTEIYFNGKRFTTRNPETKKYHYNDRKNLFIEDNQNPRDYFEYVADDHILSMSFEGPVYDMINGYAYGGLVEKFSDIFQKYGVYYEQGHAWNLTCYYEQGGRHGRAE